MNNPDIESVFRQMDEMMRQMDQFLLGSGSGSDDTRRDNIWQWPRFSRSPEGFSFQDAERPLEDNLSPRDRLLKRPERLPPPLTQPQRPALSPLPSTPAPFERRDVDLDVEQPLEAREGKSGGGWFSSWSRVEQSVRQPDGTVKRSVTTVGPDGRRTTVSRVETLDGRVVSEETAPEGSTDQERLEWHGEGVLRPPQHKWSTWLGGWLFGGRDN